MALLAALGRLLVEERGADATEYALLAALIALVIIVAVRGMGVKVNALFNSVQANLP